MSFDDDATMQKKWKAFTHKIITKTDDYGTVLKRINTFLKKTFTAAIEGNDFDKQWSAVNNQWM